MLRTALILACLAPAVHAWYAPIASRLAVARSNSILAALEPVAEESPIVTGAKKFAAGMQAGKGFKQSVADGLAGDYDEEAVKAELLELTTSAPVVVFSWVSDASPWALGGCVNAA